MAENRQLFDQAVGIVLWTMLADDVCYRALSAQDDRFDGLFFVGVSSTGIYCRSVCPARTARRRNCTFFSSAAAAEADGYRPCLRCRPELAPGLSPYEDRFARVAGAVARIRAGGLNGTKSFAGLAGGLDVSERQLRRLVKDATGATPVQLAQTARLLLAKQLLTETQLPITRVAAAAGFSSVRRFNESFLSAYRLAPGRFRREAKPEPSNDTPLTLELVFRPPYDWASLRAFMAARDRGRRACSTR